MLVHAVCGWEGLPASLRVSQGREVMILGGAEENVFIVELH